MKKVCVALLCSCIGSLGFALNFVDVNTADEAALQVEQEQLNQERIELQLKTDFFNAQNAASGGDEEEEAELKRKKADLAIEHGWLNFRDALMGSSLSKSNGNVLFKMVRLWLLLNQIESSWEEVSDRVDIRMNDLCNFLIDNQTVYRKRKFDVERAQAKTSEVVLNYFVKEKLLRRPAADIVKQQVDALTNPTQK